MTRIALALAAVCVLAVVAGLWAVGGPGQARSERRDAQRMQDLIALAQYATCMVEQAQGGQGGDAACRAPDRTTDPLTGTPYVVEETADGAIRVCAEFETENPRARVPRPLDFTAETGCLTRRPNLPRPQRVPVRL